MGTSEQNGQARWTPGATTDEEAREAGRQWGLAIAAQAVLIGGGHVRQSREWKCQAWKAQGLISRDLDEENFQALCTAANEAAAEAFALARTDEEAQAAGTRWAEVDGDAGLLPVKRQHIPAAVERFIAPDRPELVRRELGEVMFAAAVSRLAQIHEERRISGGVSWAYQGRTVDSRTGAIRAGIRWAEEIAAGGQREVDWSRYPAALVMCRVDEGANGARRWELAEDILRGARARWAILKGEAEDLGEEVLSVLRGEHHAQHGAAGCRSHGAAKHRR